MGIWGWGIWKHRRAGAEVPEATLGKKWPDEPCHWRKKMLVRESQNIPSQSRRPDNVELHRFHLSSRLKQMHVCISALQLRRQVQSVSFACVDVPCKWWKVQLWCDIFSTTSIGYLPPHTEIKIVWFAKVFLLAKESRWIRAFRSCFKAAFCG